MFQTYTYLLNVNKTESFVYKVKVRRMENDSEESCILEPFLIVIIDYKFCSFCFVCEKKFAPIKFFFYRFEIERFHCSLLTGWKCVASNCCLLNTVSKQAESQVSFRKHVVCLEWKTLKQHPKLRELCENVWEKYNRLTSLSHYFT